MLKPAEIDAALAPFSGPQRDFADVQRALESLESLYRQKGFNTVYVTVPEQVLEAGVVRLKVVEGRIGQVRVEGLRHFSEANIRASLPMLREGEAPSGTRLSENIQLANENPAKEVQVTMGVGDREGEVNARIKVNDEKPWRVVASLDNTGTQATGQHRLGVSLQHHNVLDSDQSFSLAYTTAPQKPKGVDVDIYSLGYRIPLYRLGDSIDLLYAKSSVGVPASSPSLAGALGIVGKGEILSLRYNWLLPRQGEYSSRVIFALDQRDMKSACETASGAAFQGVAGCEPYRVQPFSATYSGRWQGVEQSAGFNAGIVSNTSSSSRLSYDLASGNREAPVRFMLVRGGASLAQTLPHDWQVRFNGQLQLSNRPLVPTEQFSLAGSTAVRGFNERAVATDRGHVVQSELYTPELAGMFSIPGSLRALAFYDFGSGHLYRASGPASATLASAGGGLRYAYDKQLSWRFDLANVLDSHVPVPGGESIEKAWRAHFSLSYAY